jgi:predicted esterase
MPGHATYGFFVVLVLASGCSPETQSGSSGKLGVLGAGGAATPPPLSSSVAGSAAPAAPGPARGLAGSPGIGSPGIAGAPGSRPGVAGGPPSAPTGLAGMAAPIVPPPTGVAGGPAPSGPSTIPMATGPMPTLPAIMGDCPEFKNGIIMVAGHKSIQIAVGEKGKGGPLLFYWHGTGSSAAEGARFPGNSEIIAAGGITAAFNGNQSSGTGGDCSGTGAHNIADFNAADQIAACATKNHGIDSRRIYTTGCSAGGLQSGCMAMMRSSYIAAAVPNSGGIVAPQPWQDKHSPAIFTMHGGSSDMVIVTFSQTSASLDMTAKSHGSFVVNCDHGGGHCGAPADLQKAGWQFMKDHPWGFTESPWKTAFPPGTPTYCKIY